MCIPLPPALRTTYANFMEINNFRTLYALSLASLIKPNRECIKTSPDPDVADRVKAKELLPSSCLTLYVQFIHVNRYDILRPDA